MPVFESEHAAGNRVRGEHRVRQPAVRFGIHNRFGGRVSGFLGDEGQQSAGVYDNHAPKPVSSASTRAAIGAAAKSAPSAWGRLTASPTDRESRQLRPRPGAGPFVRCQPCSNRQIHRGLSRHAIYGTSGADGYPPAKCSARSGSAGNRRAESSSASSDSSAKRSAISARSGNMCAHR